jgi:hypothetical protein
MRRQIVSLTFAGLMGLWASPLAAAATRPEEGRETPATSAVAVQRVSIPATGLRDEAAMVLVGTALIAIAAAVRRAA